MIPPVPPAFVRRRAAFHLWLANLAFATLVGLNYLAHVPEARGLKVWLFALPALLSSVLTLTLVPAGLFTMAAHFIRSTNLLGTLQAAFWTLFLILLFADTRIYNIFRYHFNGQVWNLLYTRGSEDALHLGWQVWSTIVFGLVLFIALQSWLWRRALRSAQAAYDGPVRRRLLSPALVWAVMLPAVFVEKSIYASAHLVRDREITRLARLFPLYAPLPMEGLANKVLGVEPRVPEPVELGGFELDYPLARPELPPGGARPNLLVLVIDCLRRDMLGPEVTPHIARWAEASGCRRFENHLSAGNSTRYGLFALFYGLHGSYWFPVLAERRSPVLVDVLLEQGYDFGIFGSASMDYPELRSTLFSAVGEHVHDDFPSPHAWRRDELAGAALSRWLAERERDPDPFFAFLLLDSPHQTYSYPPGALLFTPSAPDLDYMAMTRNEGPTSEQLEAVRNRYKNAVHHSDAVVGSVLAAFRGSARYQDTWIVVTGDHGEEFRECGFFGHTSAFTPPQVEVPFLLRGPGIEPGVERRPTSHLDFAPALLEAMGADPSRRGEWCLAGNLLAPPAARRRVLSGWNELGVWTEAGILRVPLAPLEFDVEVYDYRWNLLEDDLEFLQEERATLEALGAECNRFLRQ